MRLKRLCVFDCLTSFTNVETTIADQKYVKEYVHRHDSNRDEECFEEALDPYPDDSDSSLLLAVLYLLNCSKDIS